MQRVRLGRRIDVATRGHSARPSPRGCTSVPPDPTAPGNASIRPNQLPPPAFCPTGKGSRGEQGRRVSALRTTVPRDGAHVWRPRRAGYPIPHGAGLAAAGRCDRTRAETTHSPTATADSAHGRQEGIGGSNQTALPRRWRPLILQRGAHRVPGERVPSHGVSSRSPSSSWRDAPPCARPAPARSA
jgi:hypothetical protein